RGANQIVALRRADHDLATSRLQRGVHRVSDETTALPPPDVAHRRAEVLCDDLGDLVLETLHLLVGERKVVRIGAYPELRAALRAMRRTEQHRSNQNRARERLASHLLKREHG